MPGGRVYTQDDIQNLRITGGEVVPTEEVESLPPDTYDKVMKMALIASDFEAGSPMNLNRRDWGNFALDGEEYAWQIEYPAKPGCPEPNDPFDPDTTTRILRVGLRDEL